MQAELIGNRKMSLSSNYIYQKIVDFFFFLPLAESHVLAALSDVRQRFMKQNTVSDLKILLSFKLFHNSSIYLFYLLNI